MRKPETRILVFKIGEYYSVFATYRREFIEELYIDRSPRTPLESLISLERSMKTMEEVSIALSCGDRYGVLNYLPRFKVIDGGEELVLKHRYCYLIDLLVCMLDKRGYILPHIVGFTYQTSDRCVPGGIHG